MNKLPSVEPNGYRSIDGLCGGGGMSLAQHLAGFKLVSVINHARLAIESHKIIFPDTHHFRADVRTQYADALGAADYFHMSPDCRDHSRAKGGRPLDPSVRGLAEEAPRYLLACDAKVATFENVPEFVDWGPLMELRDAEGNVQYGLDKETGEQQPLLVKDKRHNGEYYQRWVATLRAMGYVNHEWRILTSSDYGSPQKRQRYFGIFTRAGIGISWPPKTHDEFGRGGLPKWRGAIAILEEGNYGKSVFANNYVENTLNRMAEGVERYGETAAPWFMKYNSNPPSGKLNPGFSSYRPLHTLTGQRAPLIIRPVLLHPYYKSGKCTPVTRPLQTLTCKDRFALMSALVPVPGFTFAHQFEHRARPMGAPLRTMVAGRRYQYIGFFQYLSGVSTVGLPQPMPTLMCNPRLRLLSGLYAAGGAGEKVMDQPGDTAAMLRLKGACRKAGIVDLLARGLSVRESFRGQGFPDWYTLLGSETDQRKMIGNAVEVNTGRAVATQVRQMLEHHTASGQLLAPLKLRPVQRWEQGEIFEKGVLAMAA